MAHGHNIELTEQRYTFNPRLRMVSIALMAIGLVGLAYGVITFHGEHSHRLWANLLVNATFFLGLGMASAFFVSAHYLAWGGWSVVIKRVPEAIMGYIPVGAAILLAVLVFGERFTFAHAICFGAIWTALAIFAFEGIRMGAKARSEARAET
jgi:EamA domain-containing membrane protein RarD